MPICVKFIQKNQVCFQQSQRCYEQLNQLMIIGPNHEMWKNILICRGSETSWCKFDYTHTHLRTRWDGMRSVRFRFHLWPLDYHGIYCAADGRISTSILKEQTVMSEREKKSQRRPDDSLAAGTRGDFTPTKSPQAPDALFYKASRRRD